MRSGCTSRASESAAMAEPEICIVRGVELVWPGKCNVRPPRRRREPEQLALPLAQYSVVYAQNAPSAVRAAQ